MSRTSLFLKVCALLWIWREYKWFKCHIGVFQDTHSAETFLIMGDFMPSGEILKQKKACAFIGSLRICFLWLVQHHKTFVWDRNLSDVLYLEDERRKPLSLNLLVLPWCLHACVSSSDHSWSRVNGCRKITTRCQCIHTWASPLSRFQLCSKWTFINQAINPL